MAPVGEVALLLSTPPLFVLAIRGIRGEPSSRTEIGGALLAICGISIVLYPELSFAGNQLSQHLYGNMIAICAAALTAIYAYTYCVLSNDGRSPESIGVSLLTFVIGGVTLALAVTFRPAPSGLTTLNSNAVFIFLGLGVLSTAVPSLGFAVSSKRLPAIITATISLFIPVFSGMFAFLILGERLSNMFLAGGVLVILGVVLNARSSRVRSGE
jgi:drug/metabolite transporter (DMT)-like permease